MKIRQLLTIVAFAMPAAVLAGLAPKPGFVSFSRDIMPVLGTRCIGCHLTGSEPGKMALTKAAAYKNIVRIASVEAPRLQRVNPKNPDESYLLLKLEGKHVAAGGSGARMPLGGPPIDPDVLQKLRNWIGSGAPNN